MFDHLDDPNPPAPGAAERRAVATRAARLRHRQVVLAGAGAAVAAIVLAGSVIALTRGPGHSRVIVSTPTTLVPAPTTVAPTTAPPTTVAPTTTTPATTTTTAAPLPAQTVVCGALQPPGAASGPQSATATAGGVTATLTGTAGSRYGVATLETAHLTVTRDGSTVYSAAVTAAPQAPVVFPWGIGPATPDHLGDPLCIAWFAGTPPVPVVLVGVTQAGAHCCSVVDAVRATDGRTEQKDFGNPGVQVTARSDGALIVTGDNAFEYQFASFAGSGVPVQVWEWQGNGLADTTRSHPDLVAADATTWLSGFQKDPPNGLGLLAAWAGDECLLGRSAQAFAQIDQLNAEGKLSGSGDGGGWPTGGAYVQALRSFLTQHGYI